MPTLKNLTNSTRTVHGAKGTYDIKPGQTLPVDDETDWENELYVRYGLLELDEGDPAGDTGDSVADIDDLRERATALGIEVDGRWKAGRLQKEIVLAEKAMQGI